MAMANQFKAPARCPVCGNPLAITRLTCGHCGVELSGSFTPCRFCRLTEDELHFVEVFIKNRGSIKDVEKELGISYPTVRSKLDRVIASLGFPNAPSAQDEAWERKKKEIIDALERGEMTASQAAQRLRDLE
jgi:hypothetical protein